ncbi:MAG: YCF48-related protein [Bacteroidota bacterium]
MSRTCSQIYVQIVFAVKGRDSVIQHLIRIPCTGILLLCLLVEQHAFSQGTWERIPVPTSLNLYSVCFVDSLYGWAVGDSGTILHTYNGGSTWELQESTTDKEIMSVFFLTRELGWASAFNFTEPPYGTILLKTTNGGTSWTSSTYPEENIFITCIHYFDSLTGWMGGKPHALVKTTDGGVSWMQAAIDTSTLAFFPVLKIAFLNDEVGFACGGMFDIAGVIWRTTNGGDLWYAIDPSQAPADEVHSLCIFDELHVMGSGGDPDYGYGVGMIRTSDGGLSWEYEEIGFQGIAFDLDFRTASQAWSPLGPQQKLIFSSDSGYTWTEIPTPDTLAIFDITFPDSLHGCGVGYDGAVIRYIPPVQPFVKPLMDGAEWGELMVFPNPTAGNLEFEIRNSKRCFITLEVYSSLGAEIAELIHQEFSPGLHSFYFDTGKLPAGNYECVLKFDGVIRACRRMVVIR